MKGRNIGDALGDAIAVAGRAMLECCILSDTAR